MEGKIANKVDRARDTDLGQSVTRSESMAVNDGYSFGDVDVSQTTRIEGLWSYHLHAIWKHDRSHPCALLEGRILNREYVFRHNNRSEISTHIEGLTVDGGQPREVLQLIKRSDVDTVFCTTINTFEHPSVFLDICNLKSD